jgi:hypothetical protein
MRLFYAMDFDEKSRATVSGVRAFSSVAERDKFVIKSDQGWTITLDSADIACLKTHECTAHEAHQRGFI